MTIDSTFARRRGFGSRILACVAALTVVGGGATLAVQSASAAELDAITSVTVASQPISQGNYFQVEATWAIDNGHAGDTFTLNLPTSPNVDGVATSFDLKDPSGAVLGNCVVTQEKFVCTLNNYVETHTNVAGTLNFWAKATEESSESTFVFTTGTGVTIPVPIPDGGIGPHDSGHPWPGKPFKDGLYDPAKNSLRYSVYIPGSTLISMSDPKTVTDTYDPRLVGHFYNPKVYWVTQAQWTAPNPFNYNQYLTQGSDFTVIDGPGAHLTATFSADVIQADRLYILQYDFTLPAGAKTGDVFANVAAGESWSAATSVQYWGAGGDGGGDALRTINLTKRVAGDGIPDVAFDFEVACVGSNGNAVAGYPKTAQIRADGSASFDSIPVNSVCTISETDSHGADSVVFDSANPITVTTAAPATIFVTATNTFVAPPTPPTTPATTPPTPFVPVEPSTPAPPSEQPSTTPPATVDASVTPAPSSGSDVASTGSDTTALLIVASVLVLAGAIVVVIRRRSVNAS